MARRPCDVWFPFFPRDWLSSEVVGRLSLAERGIYIHLLALAWIDPYTSIPAVANEVSRLVPGARRRQVERVLDLAWPATPDGLRRQNPREVAEKVRARSLAKSRRKGAESVNSRYAQRTLSERSAGGNPQIQIQSQEEKTPLPPAGGIHCLGVVKQVFEHWKATMDHPEAKLTADRRRKIEARLREGYSPETLCHAIDGCAASKFHMGENEEAKRYDDLTLIFRSGSKVEFFCRDGDGDKDELRCVDCRSRLRAGHYKTDRGSQCVQCHLGTGVNNVQKETTAGVRIYTIPQTG